MHHVPSGHVLEEPSRVMMRESMSRSLAKKQRLLFFLHYYNGQHVCLYTAAHCIFRTSGGSRGQHHMFNSTV
jgi:hypothetical protein